MNSLDKSYSYRDKLNRHTKKDSGAQSPEPVAPGGADSAERDRNGGLLRQELLAALMPSLKLSPLHDLRGRTQSLKAMLADYRRAQGYADRRNLRRNSVRRSDCRKHRS